MACLGQDVDLSLLKGVPGLVVRDGVAVYIGPGGVPVLFDHEGVSQFIGDLMGRPGG